MRVQLSEASLRTLLGPVFTQRAAMAKSKRNRAPGLVIQSFQHMCHIRWGLGASEASELIVPPKIIPGTGADCIWSGLNATMPALCPERLDALSKHVRALVLYSFPDGLAANQVCLCLAR